MAVPFKMVWSGPVGTGVTGVGCLHRSVLSFSSPVEKDVDGSGVAGGLLAGPLWPFQYKQTRV